MASVAEAAADGNGPGLENLLRQGSSPDEHGADGCLPLAAAAMWGHHSVVQLLLKHKADASGRNRSGTGFSPLHVAALQEHGRTIMLLMQAKADPRLEDSEGCTPADYASCSESVWSFFASEGCDRTPKDQLVEKGIIRKVSPGLEAQLQQGPDDRGRGILPKVSRPGSAYVMSVEYPARPESRAAPKPHRFIDILADEPNQAGQQGTMGRSLASVG
mmetsp:Transcript_4434/g.9271  ORF Transcript_4434/g.9271 Transcript_4434/m.9271 type:complete len:217 (-) Transcript_4434:122-772(-)